MPTEAETIWSLKLPREDDVFAQAVRLGTWLKGEGCKVCGRSTEKRVPPLVIEWISGSDVIADFVWPGFGEEVIISDRVRIAFEQKYRFRSFECLPIRMVEPGWRARRVKTKSAKSPRSRVVALPYEGPPLWELRPTVSIGVVRSRSNFKYEYCAACAREFWEREEPRDPTNAVVPEESVRDLEIFSSKECAFILCKDVVKRAVESEGFTNVRFEAWGIIGEYIPIVRQEPVPYVSQAPRPPCVACGAAGEPTVAPLRLADDKIVDAKDVPENVEDLRSWSVAFPELPPSQRRRHRTFVKDLVEYARRESGYCDLSTDDLRFTRSARVGDVDYWLFTLEESIGRAYVTVAKAPSGITMGYDESHGLSPEQFLLACYFERI